MTSSDARLGPRPPWRVAVPLVLVLGLLWGVLLRDLHTRTETLEHDARAEIGNVAEVGGWALHSSVLTIDLMLQDLRMHWGSPGFAALVDTHLQRMSTSFQARLMVVDAAGRVVFAVADSPWQTGDVLPPHELGVPPPSAGGDGLTALAPRKTTASRTPMLTFARPLLGLQGAPGTTSDARGAILLAVEPGYLVGAYRATTLGLQAAAGVVRDDGLVLFRAVVSAAKGVQPLVTVGAGDGVKIDEGLLAGPVGVRRMRSPVDGVDRLIAWQRTPGYPLIFSVGSPGAELQQDIDDVRLRYLMFGGVTTLLTLAVAGALWGRWRQRDGFLWAQAVQLDALRQARDDLARSEREMRELHLGRTRLAEAERKRIGQAVHDDLGQRLTVHRMQLDALAAQAAAAGAPALAAAVEDMKSSVDDMLASVRSIADNLRPAALEMGLKVAVSALVQEFDEAGDLRVELDDRIPEDVQLSEDLALDAYRMVQEALTNVARHAQARRAWVELGCVGPWLRLQVCDDGRGLPADRPAPASGADAPAAAAASDADAAPARRGFGLVAMRERAMDRGGRLEVTPAPGGGTCLQAWLPLATAA